MTNCMSCNSDWIQDLGTSCTTSRSLISKKIEMAKLSARELSGVAAAGWRPLVDGGSLGLSGECGAQTRRARVERAVPKSSSPGENHRWSGGKRAHELTTLKVTQ